MASDIEGALPPPSGDRIYFRGQAARRRDRVRHHEPRRLRQQPRPPRPRADRLLARSAPRTRATASRCAARSTSTPPCSPRPTASSCRRPRRARRRRRRRRRRYLLDCPNVVQRPQPAGRLHAGDRPALPLLRRGRRRAGARNGTAPRRRCSGGCRRRSRSPSSSPTRTASRENFTTIVDLPLSRGQPTPEATGGAGATGADPSDHRRRPD